MSEETDPIVAIYKRIEPRGVAGSRTPSEEQRKEIRRLAEQVTRTKEETDWVIEHYRQVYEAW